jgi:hypothetical protein
MRTIAAAALLGLFAAGCQDTLNDNSGRMEYSVSNLADLHEWDPEDQGAGQPAYDGVVAWGEEVLPVLVAHLTDNRKTQIFEPRTGRNPSVGDVCFFLLLRLMKLTWKTFADDGVFVSSAFQNPLFCIQWDGALAKKKVQERFLTLLPEPPPK